MKTHSVNEVAKYFLASVDPDENDISNLKLQKLCYYAQGILSVMRQAPLFRQKIFAWDHGPVVADLYHLYKDHRNQPIAIATDFDVNVLNEPDRKALDDILKYYGQFSPWRLRNMTHEEKPWIEAYKTAQGSEITIASMKAFFEPQIEDEYVKRTYGEAV
jgi:uncharacterized phage-associated protein